MKRQKLVLNNPAQPLARNIPNPKLVKSAPLGRQVIPQQQLKYVNPAAQQTMSKRIPDHHLGHFTQPHDRLFEGVEPEFGALWATTRITHMISGAWDNTSGDDNTTSYLSPTSHKPHPGTGTSAPVGSGTMAMYLGTRRLTEWDGKGWARPVRAIFLVDGVEVAVVDPTTIRPL